jgi:hypothetical protein
MKRACWILSSRPFVLQVLATVADGILSLSAPWLIADR